MSDLYDELGVSRDATPDEIRAAYRKRAKEPHPDAGGDAEKFGALTKAYNVLHDADRRARYDQTGRADDEPDDAMRQAALFTRIRALLNQYLSQPDAEQRDVMKDMRQHVSQELGRGRVGIQNATVEIARLERLKKRFKAKGKSNLIGKALDIQIAGKKAQIEDYREQMDGFEELAKALEDYEFEWDRPPAPEASGSAGVTKVTFRVELGRGGGRW